MTKIFIFNLLICAVLITACNENPKNNSETIKQESSQECLQFTEAEDQTSSKYLTTKKLKISNSSFGIEVWKNNKEDLNGDGKADEVVIYGGDEYFTNSDEPQECYLKVSINKIIIDQKVNWPGKSYFGERTKFEIININKTDKYKELLISFSEGMTEDPSTHHSIIRYLPEQKLTVSDIISEGYSNGQIHFEGNAIVVDHGRYPDIKGTYELDGLYLKQKKLYKQPESEVDYSNMAACPYVYLLENGEKKYQGEIMRYLNEPYAEQWQRLPIMSSKGKRNSINILLSEEKEEVSFINAVYLEVNGKKYYPEKEQFTSKILYDDNSYYVLKKGEFLSLSFALDESNVKYCSLHVKGYYEPNFIRSNTVK